MLWRTLNIFTNILCCSQPVAFRIEKILFCQFHDVTANSNLTTLHLTGIFFPSPWYLRAFFLFFTHYIKIFQGSVNARSEYLYSLNTPKFWIFPTPSQRSLRVQYPIYSKQSKYFLSTSFTVFWKISSVISLHSPALLLV